MIKRWLWLLIALTALAVRGEVPRVSLLTALPGEEIYELEGHTGLRMRSSDYDYVVNWGIFDFNSPGFVYRFVKGETDYLCAAYPTDYFLADYAAQGRMVLEQPLLLDSLQTMRLVALVEENLRPENRVYRYNYVKDNCATRPLLLIERAVGAPLVAPGGEISSFRREMRKYHRDYPWYQFGIDLALGRRLDEDIDRRSAVFAPVRLAEELAGNPLVGKTIAYGTQRIESEPTPWILTPVAAGLFVMLVSLLIWRGKGAKLFDSLLFGVYGLTGCVIFFLVFVSTHEATSPNLLLLWLNPFCLLGAVLPWIKSAKMLKNCYFFINFALIIVLAILAPLLGRQMNTAFWLFMAADAIRSVANMNYVYVKK